MSGSRTFTAGPFVVVAAVLGVVACEPRPPSDAGGSSDAGGAAPLDMAAVPSLEPVEAFRLGRPDAPEPEAFTRAPPLAVHPDGTLFVLARSANEVRLFGPEGRFLGIRGGSGEGPGEFVNAYRLGLVGDTLWVRNLSPPFVSFFGSDGAYLRTERFDDAIIGRTGIPEGPEAMLAGGGWVTVGVVPWGGPSGPVEVPLLLVGPDGRRRDTLALAVDPPGPRLPGLGTLNVPGLPPLPPLHDVAPGGGEVIVAEWGGDDLEPGAVVVRRFRPDASPTQEDTLRFPPVRPAARVADSIVSAATDSARARVARIREAGIPDPPALPDDPRESVRRALALGPVLAPVRRLVAARSVP